MRSEATGRNEFVLSVPTGGCGPGARRSFDAYRLDQAAGWRMKAVGREYHEPVVTFRRSDVCPVSATGGCASRERRCALRSKADATQVGGETTKSRDLSPRIHTVAAGTPFREPTGGCRSWRRAALARGHTRARASRCRRSLSKSCAPSGDCGTTSARTGGPPVFLACTA